jgi:hypothetical protein
MTFLSDHLRGYAQVLPEQVPPHLRKCAAQVLGHYSLPPQPPHPRRSCNPSRQRYPLMGGTRRAAGVIRRCEVGLLLGHQSSNAARRAQLRVVRNKKANPGFLAYYPGKIGAGSSPQIAVKCPFVDFIDELVAFDGRGTSAWLRAPQMTRGWPWRVGPPTPVPEPATPQAPTPASPAPQPQRATERTYSP